MKRTFLLFAVVLSLLLPGMGMTASGKFHDGDIVFQRTVSFQSKALTLATGSPYTHCGMIFFKDGQPYVFEAIHTVTWTPLDVWTRRGEDEDFVLMRLKKPLDAPAAQALRQAALSFEGRNYDIFFNWTDENIYCSELVWKAYQRGVGLELTPLKTFEEYALDHAEVQRIAKERFNYEIPLTEKAVAPADLMESPLLEIIEQEP